MENEMIMNNVEENNNVELTEGASAGAKVVAVAVAAGAAAAVGAVVYGFVWLAGKAKNAWNERKAKKIREAEYVELGENQIDSEDESND